MPVSPMMVSVRCSGAWRPSARLEPAPSTASGVSAASASATASRTSSSLFGANTAVMERPWYCGARKRYHHDSATPRKATGPSEPRQVGEAGLAAVDVDAAELGAAVQGREDLARIQELLGVERA